MKRLISVLLAMFILSGSFSLVTAKNTTNHLNGFEVVTSLPENSSYLDVSEGLELGFTTNSEKGDVKINKPLSIDSNVLVMTVTFMVSCIDSVNRCKITVKDPEKASNTCDLINIQGTELYSFAKKSGKIADLEPGIEYTVTLAVDNSDKSGTVWYNSECIFSGNLGTAWKNFDMSDLVLEVRNYTTLSATIDSEFFVSKLLIGKGGELTSTLPENGDSFVEVSEESGIKLFFDGIIPPAMLNDKNYKLTENGTEKKFTVSEADGAVLIIPENGYAEQSKYELTILKITDILNNTTEENRIIEFETTSADYKKAEIFIQCSSTEIYEGESAKISVIVKSGNIENMCIIVNDEIVKEFTEAPYEYTLSEPEGTYVIGAFGTDSYGGKTIAENVTVSVHKNEAPEIFSALTDGKSYSKAFLEKVLIEATDSDGSISKVQALLDGEFFKELTEAPYVFDFSKVKSGRHTLEFTATDNHNKTSSAYCNILIEGNVNLTENNFWDMENGSSMKLNKAGGSEDFIYTAEYAEYTEEHGTVAEFTTGTDGKGNQCYVLFPTSVMKGKYQVEMDIYPDFTGGGQLMFLQRQSSMANTSHEITFYSDRIQFRTTNGAEHKTVTYEQKKWHHIIYTINHYNNTYSFSMDNEILVSDVPFQNSTIEGPSELRGIASFAKDQRIRFLFDNLKLSAVDEEPVIKSVGDEFKNEAEAVSPYSGILYLNLSSAIDKDITAENISLSSAKKEVKITEALVENSRIKLTLDEPLDSQREYIAEISNIKTVAGSVIKDNIDITFKTDYYKADLKNLIKGVGNSISGTLVNQLDDNKIYYIVLASFKGEQMQDITVKKITAKKGENPFTTDVIQKNTEDFLRISVWDSLTESVIYTVKNIN